VIRRCVAPLLAIAWLACVAVPALAGPTEDVRAALLRFNGLSSFRMDFAIKDFSGTMEFAKPDALRIRASGLELVRVGSDVFVNARGHGWQRAADSPAAPLVPQLLRMGVRVRRSAMDPSGFTAVDLGTQTIAGEALHAYRRTVRADGAQDLVYVAHDGFVHRITSVPDVTEGTLTFSAFNHVAPIVAPM
jgi:hypothetical protein